MKKITLPLALLALLVAAQAFAQEPTVAPPESLVVDGVPKIPVSLAETVSRYGAYRAAAFVDWQPNTNAMLISTRFAETPQLHVVFSPGGARRQLTFFPDAVRNARFRPNGGDCLVFSKDIGGGEWYQLYRFDLATGVITLLTDGKSRNLLGPWSNKGDHLAYMSTRRTGKDTDLWIMDPGDPKSGHLLAQLPGGGWQPLDWSPGDSQILLLEELSINESYLWLVDTKSGEKTPLTTRDSELKIAYADGRFAKDGKGLYVTTDKDSEFLRLAYIDLASKNHKYFTSDIPWDVADFDLSKDGRHLAFAVNQGGQDAIHLLDTTTGIISNPKHPPGVITGLRWNPDARELAFTLSNARVTGDVYSLEPVTGKIHRWTESESAVPTANFPEAELVSWRSFDARMISGFLYHPPVKFTGKRPVLIVIHGGPEGQSQPAFVGRSNYYLNELGIALIYPNVRGSTGYGKTYSLLDNGFHRQDTYKDIDSLFDWIAAQPNLDSSRIAVTGGSYGGHMTLAVSAFYSGRIRCSIDIVGMSNLVTFLEHTEAYRRDLRRVEYGDERDPQMRNFLETIAPMNNIAKIKKPMMVVAGKNDPRVPISESEQIVSALQAQNTPVWYVMAKDEGHGFQKKANQDFQFLATIEFLREYLLK